MGRRRRRRVRRVSRAQPARARQPVVEGQRRLAALRGRAARRGADRAVRGAGLRLRREAADGRARAEVWRDRELADRLEREGASSKRALRRGVLVGTRRLLRAGARQRQAQVDSLTSNIGHLLWSGIVPHERVDSRRRLPDGARRSGRAGACGRCRRPTPATTRSRTTTARSGRTTTRSAQRGWRATGRWPEPHRIVRRMLAACRHFDYQLPEVFAGCRAPTRRSRSHTRRPRARRPGRPARRCCFCSSCSACRPTARQGWLDDGARVPSWAGDPAGGDPGLRAHLGRSRREWGITVERTGEDRDPQSRSGSPSRPPATAGSMDRVAARGRLVDAGHEVTLFASGDSLTKAKLVVRLRPGAERADRPHRAGAPSRARCYARADDFDVINDHSGLTAAALGGALETPVVHTVHGPLDGEPGRPTSRSRRSRPTSA